MKDQRPRLIYTVEVHQTERQPNLNVHGGLKLGTEVSLVDAVSVFKKGAPRCFVWVGPPDPAWLLAP
jgi:hypothetical protein